MTKPKIVVYAVNSGGMPKGPKYQNPEWFDAVHKDAAKVIVVGNWPNVVETYRGLGIPVEVVDQYPPRTGVQEPQSAAPVASINPGGVIPADWENLPWAAPEGETTIRKVAQQFTEAVVINRKHAAKIIREELARRG